MNPYQKLPLRVSIYNPAEDIITQNYFLVGQVPNSVLVALKNKNTKEIHNYYKPLFKQKSVIGGDEDNNLEDFNTIDTSTAGVFKDTPKNINQKVIPVSDITQFSTLSVYPEDTLADIKHKIQILTGIPIYRQHVFYSVRPAIHLGFSDLFSLPSNIHDEDLDIKLPYKTTINGENYKINIRDYKSSDTQELAGIKFDQLLEQNKENLQILALDTFQTLETEGALIDAIYVADLEYILATTRKEVFSVISDQYQFDLLYYGFIIKFWPQLPANGFYSLITNNPEKIREQYPALDPPIAKLTRRYQLESQLIDHMYKNIDTVKEKYYPSLTNDRANVAITNAVIHIDTTNFVQLTNKIKIRNIFDWIGVTEDIPVILLRFSMQFDGLERIKSQYLNVVKRHVSVFNPKYKKYKQIERFINKTQKRSHVSFILHGSKVNNDFELVYLSIYEDGKYTIEGNWNEDRRMNFHHILQYFNKTIHGLLTQINEMGAAALPENIVLTPPKQKSKISLGSLTIITFWPEAFTTKKFEEMKTHWQQFEQANIISVKNFQQQSIFSFSFKKGIVNYDPQMIQKIFIVNINSPDSGFLQNTYLHLIDNGVAQKWNYIYLGRNVRIYHRITNLKIEMCSVNNQEFERIWAYVFTFFDKFSKTYKSSSAPTEKKIQRQQKNKSTLKYLHEQDPDLYDLRKYDAGTTVYSVVCQNPRPPDMYKEEDLKTLDKSKRNKVIKFWNFTEKTSAYYLCNNKKFPYLSFLTGKHPLGYCLPCCQKTKPVYNSKRSKKNETCLKKYMTVEDNDEEMLIKNKTSKHVLTYGKHIPPGRMSMISHKTEEGLFRGVTGPKLRYRLLGVEQNTLAINNAGLFYSLGEILNKEPYELVEELCNSVMSSPDKYRILAEGRGGLFRTNKELAGVIIQSFLNQAIFTEFASGGFAEQFWKDIIIDLVRVTYNLHIIFFNDPTGLDNINIKIPSFTLAALQNIKAYVDNSNIKICIIFNIGGVRPGTYPLTIFNQSSAPKVTTITKIFTYDKEDWISLNIINILLDLVKTNQPKFLKLGLNEIKEIITKLPEYVITQKLINLRNLCYGVIITKNETEIYFPIDYSPHFVDGIPIHHGPRPPTKNNNDDVIELINQVNSQLFENDQIKIVASMQSDLKQNIGIVTKRYGAFWNYFYHLPNSDSVDNAVLIPYDMRMIDQIIYDSSYKKELREFPKDKDKIANYTLYDNYLYKFLLTTFASVLKNDTNSKIRAQIARFVDMTDFTKVKSAAQFRTNVRELLAKFPNDIIKLQNHIFDILSTHKTKINEKVHNLLDNIKFDFDQCTIYKLRAINDKNELIKKIDASLRPKITIKNEVDITEPINIYFACDNSSTVPQPQCSKSGKLMVPRDRYEQMLEILAQDIKNKLKEFTVSGITSGIIDKLNFIQRPGEIITFIT
nr:hypothetical protein [Abalone asfa-like virus]